MKYFYSARREAENNYERKTNKSQLTQNQKDAAQANLKNTIRSESKFMVDRKSDIPYDYLPESRKSDAPNDYMPESEHMEYYEYDQERQDMDAPDSPELMQAI